MKRKPLFLLLAAIGLVGALPAHAESSVTLSGFIDLNYEHITSSGKNTAKNRLSSGGLNNSRFNMSGREDLGNGNTAYFTIEPMFSADTGAMSAQFRQSFVGVRGNWGDISMGRMFTPSFWVAGYADPSWAAAYSMVNSMQFFYAAYRVDNAISYRTPTVNNFYGRLFYAFGRENAALAKDGRFLSASVEYRNGPLWLGLAHQTQYIQDIYNKSVTRPARDNFLSGAYRMGGVEPTLTFHTYDGYYAYPPYVGFSSKGWDVQAGVRWNIDGVNRMHASYVYRHDDNNVAIGTAKGIAVGFLHGLSKRTDLYVSAAHIWNRQGVKLAYPITWIDATPDAGQSPTGVQFGIRHAF